VYFPRNFPVYRYAHCGMLSAMKSGLRDFERSLHSGFAVDGELNNFPSSTIQSGKKLRYLQGFPRSACWPDGKIQKQNAEKNFTVRFTVKTIRLGAIYVDRRRKVIF